MEERSERSERSERPAYRFMLVEPDANGNIDEADSQEDVRLISSVDEYGGEWGGFYLAIDPMPSEDWQPTAEEWTEISQIWERYCAGIDDLDGPDEWEPEWEFLQATKLGPYNCATFVSNDRGGYGLFVMHG